MLYSKKNTFCRRKLLKGVVGGVILCGASYPIAKWYNAFSEEPQSVFISSVSGYDKEIRGEILSGFKELGVTSSSIKGKSVLLKPNLVEPHAGKGHINTHPLVVRAVAEAFLYHGASEVLVGEGAGHMRDSFYCLELSGLGEVLEDDSIPFVDLNTSAFSGRKNLGRTTRLGNLYLPDVINRADIVVSIAKMKIHHWAGVTLSMKNMFGVMPGRVYGWPKNVLHHEGISNSIIDINATVQPDFAIVDGIVGMEGDGPIMGEPIAAGVLVMGCNPVSVDATCSRLMGIDPHRIKYLQMASGWLGSIGENAIENRGESIQSLRHDFKLLESIPAHQGIRLT